MTTEIHTALRRFFYRECSQLPGAFAASVCHFSACGKTVIRNLVLPYGTNVIVSWTAPGSILNLPGKGNGDVKRPSFSFQLSTFRAGTFMITGTSAGSKG